MNKFIFLIIFVASSIFTQPSFAKAPNDGKNSKLQQLAQAIMEYQETRYGIHYGAPPPRIIYTDKLVSQSIAQYSGEHEQIEVGSSYKVCNIAPLLKNVDGQMPPPKPGECDLSYFREIMAHELGHYYTHLVIKRNAPDSWLAVYFKHDTKPDPETMGINIVVEGLGQYFGSVFSAPTYVFPNDGWRIPFVVRGDFSKDQKFTKFCYYGGYTLVKNILVVRGVANGTVWLISHPLSVQLPDLSPVLGYQTLGTRSIADSK